MALILVLLVPFAGGMAAWLSERVDRRAPKWISLLGLAVDFYLVLLLWLGRYGTLTQSGPWIAQFQADWLPRAGVSFHLALDGVSLILVVLTVFIGFMASASSWTEIRERSGFFYFNLNWTLGGVIGVFLAMDLLLFYFFWELMLVPMYFLIALWGHEQRFRAAVKFFIFTQLSGLLMIAAILALYFFHGSATGTYSFDYGVLLHTPLDRSVALPLLLGFVAAFVVKLPAVPFHTWLPDAHTQAPTAGSVILAGLLLKTGAYGLFRFAIPLFPSAIGDVVLPLSVLGVIGIIYGAILAYAQTDLKRLVAYTSVSHMGFVLLGLFAGTKLAFQGAMLQIVCHALSTGGLFILAGSLQERTGTRELSKFGGLWNVVPRLGGVSLFFALASLGLPGLGNFIAEFLVVLGTYQVNATLAVIGALGFIFSTVYALWIVQRVFYGGTSATWRIPDLSVREMAVMTLMIVPLVVLGWYPQPLINKLHTPQQQWGLSAPSTRPPGGARSVEPPPSSRFALPNEVGGQIGLPGGAGE